MSTAMSLSEMRSVIYSIKYHSTKVQALIGELEKRWPPIYKSTETLTKLQSDIKSLQQNRLKSNTSELLRDPSKVWKHIEARLHGKKFPYDIDPKLREMKKEIENVKREMKEYKKPGEGLNALMVKHLEKKLKLEEQYKGTTYYRCWKKEWFEIDFGDRETRREIQICGPDDALFEC